MKKIVYLSLSLLFAGMLLVSCNKNTPKDVAQVWLTGYNQMDFEEPMKVSTNDTRAMLSDVQQLTEKVADSARKELKKIKVNIKDVKVNGDNAVVTYTTTDNPKDQTLKLVKQDNKWLVQFSKLDMQGSLPQQEVAAPAEGEVPAGDTTRITVPAATTP